MAAVQLIEVQGLTKFYGSRPAIVDLTFSVPRGQVLGFLGPVGAGKSTTMRILAGYLRATSGAASVAGYDVTERSREARRSIGYLPETTPLYGEMSAERFLETMCRLRGVPPRKRRLRIDYALTACGLTEHRRHFVGHLSNGLRRRVGLAQAVVHDPQVLVLDATVTSDGEGEKRLTVTGDAEDLQDAVARVIVNQGDTLRGLNSRSLAPEETFPELVAQEAP